MSLLKDTVIEKLNFNNYDVWKFKVEMYLLKEDLYNIIINNTPNPLTDGFRNKNRKVGAITNLLIEDDQIIHAQNLETARECWLALKTFYERINLSSNLFLLRKLYSIKSCEGGNKVDHITKIYQTHDKLKAIGENIKEQHLTALLLCSLPPRYDI